MFNILNFIDSPDVREYNRDTHFEPIEQAAIIYHSQQPIEAKLAAWRELLNTCSEEEFAAGTISGGWLFVGGVCETFSHRDIVADLVTYYETALELRTIQKTDVIFALNITIPFRDPTDTITKNFYFSSYAKAIAHLQKYQEERKEKGEPDMIVCMLICEAAVYVLIYLHAKDTQYTAAHETQIVERVTNTDEGTTAVVPNVINLRNSA